jgi:cytochrome c556
LRTAVVITAALLAIAVAAPLVRAEEPKPNPVQLEMRLLEAAMKDSVSAIAAGDVTKLPKQLHQVHMAAGDTGAALKDGSYKPPRNAEKVAEFIALDEAFHKAMIQMVKAARKNDLEKTATHFGGLMQRCHGCHAQFRALPPERKSKP